MKTDLLKLIETSELSSAVQFLQRQHDIEPYNYDLCVRSSRFYFDVVLAKPASHSFWSLRVSNIEVFRGKSRQSCIDFLKDSLDSR